MFALLAEVVDGSVESSRVVVAIGGRGGGRAQALRGVEGGVLLEEGVAVLGRLRRV